MVKEKFIEEVKQRISGLIGERDKELLDIQTQAEKAFELAESAEKEMAEAAKKSDFKAYGIAKDKKENSKSILEMLSSRRDLLMTETLVSQEESDSVKAALQTYENEQMAITSEAIYKNILEIKERIRVYSENIRKTEGVMTEWIKNIDPKYIRTQKEREAKGLKPELPRIPNSGNGDFYRIERVLNAPEIMGFLTTEREKQKRV